MHIVINKKRINIINANTFFKRLSGLMFKKNIDYGILFNKCNSIHTFFMKENIDIIGLDKNNIVICKYENLSKNKIVKIKNKLTETKILELPKNSSKNVKINKELIFFD